MYYAITTEECEIQLILLQYKLFLHKKKDKHYKFCLYSDSFECVLLEGFLLWLLFSQPWVQANRFDGRFASRGNCYYYSAVICVRVAVPQESSSNNSLL